MPIDEGDAATLRASPVLDPADVAAAFPAALLSRQAWDQEAEAQQPGRGADAYAFVTRIADLVREAEAYGEGVFEPIVALDVLDAQGSRLWCLPEAFSERKCTFGDIGYVNYLTKAIHDLTAARPPALLVVGQGMNRFATSAPELWEAFAAWFVGPAAANVGRTPLATALDWEALRADAEARAETLVAAGQEAEAALEAAFAAVWDEQIVRTGVAERQAVVVLQSRPTARRADEIPDDYYARLLPLIAPNTPVAFLPLAWSTGKGGGSPEAVKFLARFRRLAAGLNVTRIAWARLVDPDATRCNRLTNPGELGLDSDVCQDGLLDALGRPKSIWDELLDEARPVAP